MSEEEAKAINEEQLNDKVESGPEDQVAHLEQIESLEGQLEEAKAQAEENIDGWKRAQAEFANYKKRMARDQEQISKDARGRIVKRFLEIADDMERALSNGPEDGQGAEWAKGVELVYRKLLSYLEAEGVTQMVVAGEMFDPNLHEAVVQEVSKNYSEGEIIDVLEPGYMLGDRVLRPAKVKVAK